MIKSKDKFLTAFSVIFLCVCAALTVVGTIFDTQISFALFSPQNKVSVGFEAFGQISHWIFWGPIFSVLFLTRHSLKEYFDIFSVFIPFIKPIKNTETKIYKVLDKTVNIFTAVLFFALCVIGWKKAVQNTVKHITDLNEAVYFAVCIVIAALSIFAFSKMKRETLQKLEYFAAAGLFVWIFLKIAENLKPLTHRVRFREMVAYSNGIVDEKGLSHGTYTHLSPVLQKEMAKGTDISAFTKWFRIGDDMGIYSKADSFPSGHVMNSTAIFLTYILFRLSDKCKKYAPLALVFSVLYVCIMALSRIIAGAHYLTDVVFAMIIGYCIFLCAYKLYNYSLKKLN